MKREMTNLEIAELLRQMAAAYQILNENRFKIIAYERAADSIEHLTSEVKDLWDDGKLGEIPGVGASIAQHLDELFRKGKVGHFDETMAKVPRAVFPLLLVPGLGPKKAYKLVTELKIKDDQEAVDELEWAAKAHQVAPIEGFGEKSEQDIIGAIATFKKGQIKEKRMELPLADGIAQEVTAHLKKHSAVQKVDALGSLRRGVSTIGDIDIAVATTKPQEVVSHFTSYPHRKLIEKGPTGATLLLQNGRQVDLRVQKPQAYGAMLQYFTGSKHHNIKLREYALDKGLSLSEHGIKVVNQRQYKRSLRQSSGRANIKYQKYPFGKTSTMSSVESLTTGISKIKKIKNNTTVPCRTEEEFYGMLGLPLIPPELREDKGEIEAALRQAQGKLPGLPKLVELFDVKGDLHIHTDYDLEPSHDLGADALELYLDRAFDLGYEYLGISDHNPSVTNHSSNEILEIMKRRKEYYEQQYSSWVKKVSKTNKTSRKVGLFIMCEVDILSDGKLALPEKAFECVDAVIAAIHSSFTQEKSQMTRRLISALTAHPKVRILGHPLGRLLGKREGVELSWPEIFAVCQKQGIALEINAYPQRLDLPDNLVFEARKEGLLFCINTDAHAVFQMDLERYGVSVARRGWVERRDIVNTMEYNVFKSWLLRP